MDDDTFGPNTIRRLRAAGWCDAAVTAFAAWVDHTETCDGCTRTYTVAGADEHQCAESVRLLGDAISANTRACAARRPVDYHADVEEPAAVGAH